jgi:hypothetical protein
VNFYMALELGVISCVCERESIYNNKRVDNLVGIATGYGLDGRGSIPGRGKRFFSTASMLAHPASYPVGNGGSFPNGKTGRA